MKKWLAHIMLMFSLLSLNQSCIEDPYAGDCYIPPVSVSGVINMNLPEYFHLQNIGSYMYLDQGNRGIFLVHNYDDRYYALERTCPYQSDLSCSKVVADSINLQLRCGEYADTGFVECCSSLYRFDGIVIQGPSRCNLKNYRVSVDNNSLYISN